MADKTVTVKSAGGDYTTLNAALAGESIDLVTNTRILTIECYASAAPDTTKASTGTGYTTSALYYIHIVAPASERHAGVWNTGKYHLEAAVDGAGALDISEAFTRVTALQVRNTTVNNTGDTSAILGTGNLGASTTIFLSTIIARGGRDPIRLNFASTTRTSLWNSIAYGGHASAGRISQVAGNGLDVYSTTVAGGATGILQFGGTVTAKNCYASGSSAAYSGSITKTTCASSDTTGSVGLQNIAYDTTNFTNVTAGSEDLHIPTGSGLKDVGTDTSGDAAPMNFTDDIDGNTRSGTWDVGADEFVAAGASVATSGWLVRPEGPAGDRRTFGGLVVS